MSEKYKFNDPNGIYFVTTTVVGWIDLFTRSELKHVIIDSLQYCQKQKGLIIHAWCIMPSHLHLIISTKGEPLSNILRDFKKFTAKELVKVIDRIHESRKGWLLDFFMDVANGLNRVADYKVWQDGNHPLLLSTNQMLQQKLDYLHDNPVVAEIVDEPEEYRYSSARDYYTKKKGPLEIVFID
jgi:REP element-mobilizing transposase RayT